MKFFSVVSLLLSLVILVSCSVKQDASESSVTNIEGAWVQPIEGQNGVQGYFLHPDSSLGLINIASMSGDSWHLEGDKLFLTTHTERYPEPQTTEYKVAELSEDLLVLKRGNGSLEYSRPQYSTDLVNTRWIVQSINGVEKIGQSEREVFVRFVDGENLKGFAGCNNFFGGYSADKKTIEIGSMGSTRMYCPEMDFETAYISLLSKIDSYIIVLDRLYLYENNKPVAVFKAMYL